MARSKWKGSKSFRRLMKNVEPAVRAELVHAMSDGGARLAKEMQARAPSKTGATRRSLRHRVLLKSLRLQVGLLGRPINRRLFYANILDKGRKAQVAKSGRRVGAIAAMRFVTGRFPDLRREMGRQVKGIWDRALRKAAAGAGND